MNNPPIVPVNTQGPPVPPVEGAVAGPANDPQSAVHNYLAFFRGRIVVVVILVLAALFSLVTVLVLRADLQPTSWDITVTHEIQELPSAPVGSLLVAVSQPGFAPWNFIMVGLFVVFFLVLLRMPIEALFVGLAGAGGGLAELVKNLVDRPRPTPDFANVLGALKSYSFPSGHVTGYTIIFGFLFYLTYAHLPPRSVVRTFLLIFFALLVVLIGPSRVYMGQHWASDALAGYALGFIYLLLLIEAYRFVLLRKAEGKT